MNFHASLCDRGRPIPWIGSIVVNRGHVTIHARSVADLDGSMSFTTHAVSFEFFMQNKSTKHILFSLSEWQVPGTAKVYDPHPRQSAHRVRRDQDVLAVQVPVRNSLQVHIIDDTRDAVLYLGPICVWIFL